MSKSIKQKDEQPADERLVIERVQTGVKIEKRILKVLKGLAEYHDMTLGDLLEGIVLHAFEGLSPFGEPSLKLIIDLKKIYNLDLEARDSHQLHEVAGGSGGGVGGEDTHPAKKSKNKKIKTKR